MEVIRQGVVVIIDSHTPSLPARGFRGSESLFRGKRRKTLARIGFAAKRAQATGMGRREQMIHDMDEAGIDRCALLAWYWENPETCLLHNEWHAGWINEDPERFYAFAALHPGMEDPLGNCQKGMNKDFPESANVTPGLKDFPCTTQFGCPAWNLLKTKDGP